MGVCKLKKVFIFALKAVEDDVLAAVQSLGALHLEDARQAIAELADAPETAGGGGDPRALASAETALRTLAPYAPKRSLVERLRAERRRFTLEQLAERHAQGGASDVVAEVIRIHEDSSALEREKASLAGQIETLSPWESLTVPLRDAAAPAEGVVGLFVRIAAPDAARLAELGDTTACQVIATSEKDALALVAVFRDEADDVRQRVSDLDAEVVNLPLTGRAPRDEIVSIRERMSEIDQTRRRHAERLAELAENVDRVKECRDYLSVLIQREEALERLANTERVSIIAGYVPEDRAGAIEKRLEPFGSSVTVTFADVAEDEDAPVLLKNNDVVGSFEIVTNIFGLPGRSEFDPTPLLTPFFALFFAIAITDAGYGIIIAVTTLCVIRFLKPSVAVRRFMLMMFVAGCMTIVLGALTGGWFGIDASKLPTFLQKCIIIIPMEKPVEFLFFALALGVLQLWLGMWLSFYKHARNEGFGVAICADLPWILFLPTATAAVVGMIAGNDTLYRIGLWGAGISAVLIVLLNGYRHRNILLRIGAGAYALYGGISLIGDVLSYSRLMAFGLATAGIAMVVNQLGAMVRGVPVIGLLLMVILLVFGHAFNMAINSFGGWIHTARLQFIEFFGRFYEGGGRAFVPLAPRTKYVEIDE